MAAARKWRALLIAAAAIAVIQFGGLLSSLDDDLAAMRASMTPRAASGGIVVVEIDSASLSDAGRWPWPRERFARAISNLHQAGAAVIGFDVDFSTQSDSENDAAFRDAIQKAPGQVILPTFLQRDGISENSPYKDFIADAVVASVNVPLDRDGRVRTYYRGYKRLDSVVGSMGAVLAGAAYGSTAPFEIDYGINPNKIDRISFQDVYRGNFNAERVRGKAVVIGATALELGDHFATSIQPSMPGVYIHALAYESLKQGRALASPSGLIVFLLALMALRSLWPVQPLQSVPTYFAKHAAAASLAIFGPVLVQAVLPLSLSLAPVLAAQAVCVVVFLHQELARREQQIIRQQAEHLAYLADHDSESGLLNRRALLTHVDALKAQTPGMVCVIALGIDRFPILRGAIGFENANDVVQAIADRLKDAAEGREVYQLATAILGIVVEGSDAASLHADARALVERINSTVYLADQEIEVEFRIGYVAASLVRHSAEEILAGATLALDEANLHHEKVACHDLAKAVDPKVQLALLSEVNKGVARGEFHLLYQPKASAANGLIVGAEALMRWRHPTHGDIAPDRFIIVAEETGAIHRLTRWAISKAVADQLALRAQGVETIISVNVSGRSLGDEAFCEFAISEITKHQASICLEITETAIVEDPDAALRSIAAFRDAGIRISVDDFGSGLSSLSYLKLIRADELKLDKSLTKDIRIDGRDRMILKSTIDLAHGLGMKVVVEGIEDIASAAIVSGLGCDSIQGYLIGRPMTLDGYRDLFAAQVQSAAHPSFQNTYDTWINQTARS